MSIYAGIDLGTSGIKIVLMDEAGDAVASASRTCSVDRPHPGWSQQNPDVWWSLTTEIFDELVAKYPEFMARLTGISLSGQMLGPVLLDASDRPVTPCILWNDQRALAECDVLLSRVPDIGRRTNGQPDPGLGAPKLLWLAQHAPDVLERTDVLMLPKDFVRLQLTGERGSDYTDCSGTMLMDCATRHWDDTLLAAAGWTREKLPHLFESFDVAGSLKTSLCRRWGTPRSVVVATGCGDNYAGALGVGATKAGQAALSIGTSGVLSAVDDTFRPAPEQAILTTPHAAPQTFLSMGVVMSATQSLDWIAALTQTDVEALVAGVEARISGHGFQGMPLARPSLTGVRTPDNKPGAGAAFSSISAVCDKVDLTYAVLEGVAFQFYDSYQAQRQTGVPIETVAAVGGGTRSHLWMQIIATLFDTPIDVPKNGAIAACLGAAKLAQAASNENPVAETLSVQQPVLRRIEPVSAWSEALNERHAAYRELPFH